MHILTEEIVFLCLKSLPQMFCPMWQLQNNIAFQTVLPATAGLRGSFWAQHLCLHLQATYRSRNKRLSLSWTVSSNSLRPQAEIHRESEGCLFIDITLITLPFGHFCTSSCICMLWEQEMVASHWITRKYPRDACDSGAASTGIWCLSSPQFTEGNA